MSTQPSTSPPGHTRWIIADGYIPPQSTGDTRQLVSHDAICILNAGDRDGQVRIMIYFADREPAGPYRFTVAARRTRHVRFNELSDPAPVPRDTDYASVIESDVPIVVQHTRLDSRQQALALMTTIAFPC
ncbi:MAG: sensory rhodopsin transducer [Gemmatimonadales bacterium]